MFVFAGAATGLMSALNPLVAGVALKLEASKTAEIDSRAIERATCSAQAWVELFLLFFHRVVPVESVFISLIPLTIPAPAFRVEVELLNCINCNPIRNQEPSPASALKK